MSKIIIKIVRILIAFQKRYTIIIFDRQAPPAEGDTITIGYLMAEFKKTEHGKNMDKLVKAINDGAI